MNLYKKLASYFFRRTHEKEDGVFLKKLSSSISYINKKDIQGMKIRTTIFFNASTRIEGLSQNAAFSILSAKALEIQGIPVFHFVCRKGMSRCVLGTNKDDFSQDPPCLRCIQQSRRIYPKDEIIWFEYLKNTRIEKDLAALNLDQMADYQYQGIPLGQLTLAALRWTLRRHHFDDNQSTKRIFAEFILSAWSVAENFRKVIEKIHPKTIVVFNGQFFPEAIVRYLGLKNEIRVITHEVALQPLSAFFTDGEATAYPIEIPKGFKLNRKQNLELNQYLEKRFQGGFSMAGIRFWPEMKELGKDFWEKAEKFKQVIPIFTNVVFDTSQGHANTVFPDMFTWLDLVLESIKKYPDTFFIIRAHPDEDRKGKESRESVAEWVQRKAVTNLPNVLFVGSNEYFSSYEIIQKSKFVMVYNSTIGLEASLMGMPVLCAGKARYTQYPIVFFPENQEAYEKTLFNFLEAKRIYIPEKFQDNARKFLYFQLFRTSLPFEQFLTIDPEWNGYVHLKNLSSDDLFPEKSKTMQVIINGILKNDDFIMDR